MEVIGQATVTESAPERPDGSPSPEAEAEEGLRFADPYWDEAFCAWWDPTLGTCC